MKEGIYFSSEIYTLDDIEIRVIYFRDGMIKLGRGPQGRSILDPSA